MTGVPADRQARAVIATGRPGLVILIFSWILGAGAVYNQVGAVTKAAAHEIEGEIRRIPIRKNT